MVELVRVLRAPDPPSGRLYGVPKPPPHFRPRPDVVTRLAACLLEDHEAPVVLDDARQRVVLTGMGGAGKTVVATAFVRAASVRRTFGDGVFWFDQHTGLDGRVVVDAVESRLVDGEIFDKTCLIVLDNVESVRFVEPVAAAIGGNSRILVVTRDGRIAENMGAERVDVDDLTEREAIEHLSDWTGIPPEDLPAQARTVAQATGGNALALTLAGAFLNATHHAYDDLLASLSEARLDMLDRELIGYEYDGVLRSIEASVMRLSESARSLLQDLVVVPPGAAMPVDVVHRLWSAKGGPRHEAVRALMELAGLRLVRDGPDGVSLHDLQHLYLRAGGGDASLLHARLVDAYGPPEAWEPTAVPAYLYRFLSHHLVQAHRTENLIGLLTENPFWMRASLARLNDVQPVRQDVQRALEGVGVCFRRFACSPCGWPSGRWPSASHLTNCGAWSAAARLTWPPHQPGSARSRTDAR